MNNEEKNTTVTVEVKTEKRVNPTWKAAMATQGHLTYVDPSLYD